MKVINTYSMNTYVLLHLEHKMTSQSSSDFCIELEAAGEYNKEFSNLKRIENKIEKSSVKPTVGFNREDMK